MKKIHLILLVAILTLTSCEAVLEGMAAAMSGYGYGYGNYYSPYATNYSSSYSNTSSSSTYTPYSSYGSSIAATPPLIDENALRNNYNSYMQSHAEAYSKSLEIGKKRLENISWQNVPVDTYAPSTSTSTPSTATSYSGSSNTTKQKTTVRNKCPYCTNGYKIQHESVATYGLDGPSTYCNICNKSWSYGTVHAHHQCNHCKGKGYTEYSY